MDQSLVWHPVLFLCKGWHPVCMCSVSVKAVETVYLAVDGVVRGAMTL